jgi:uncharacterized protein YjiS (DUF1127 family)
MLSPFARRLNQWLFRRYTIRRLSALDNHLLADIGTSRDCIDSFVDGRNT